MGRRAPRNKRIEQSRRTGMDLDSVEAFCRSARANGAPGDLVVRAAVNFGGAPRRMWVDIPEDSTPPVDHGRDGR